MDYPSDFNTPAFPAGKSVAITRFMGIGTLILFFLIICLCGTLIFVSHSRGIEPFLVSVNPITGQWTLVDQDRVASDLSMDYSLQESVVGTFVQNWFFISDVAQDNELLWAQCAVEQCAGTESAPRGYLNSAICCGAGEDLYRAFVSDVMPDYALRADMGERWVLDFDSIQIAQASRINANGGTWRVMAQVQSNVSGAFRIIAFVKVARNRNYYPLTLGYYVADFNAYRIGQ